MAWIKQRATDVGYLLEPPRAHCESAPDITFRRLWECKCFRLVELRGRHAGQEAIGEALQEPGQLLSKRGVPPYPGDYSPKATSEPSEAFASANESTADPTCFSLRGNFTDGSCL